MEWITEPQAWVALATLTFLEVVLGIDNIIFIAILAERLPERARSRARTIGLSFAMVTRVLLLLSIAWIMRLTTPLFSVFSQEISGRDLILLAGGLFLLGKSTLEIHHKLESPGGHQAPRRRTASFWGVIFQIGVMDLVFSLDSVVTAIGMARHVPVMVLAIVIAVLVMMVAAGPVARFVSRHPTIQMLALSFLLLIGLALVADGIDVHIPKSSIYFAIGFSVFVEMLNLRLRGRAKATPRGAR